MSQAPGSWRGGGFGSALALLLVAVFFRGIAWMISLPAWEGPDETDHFSYVQALAESHRLPVLGRDGFAPAVEDSIRRQGFSPNDWLSEPAFGQGSSAPQEGPALRPAPAVDRRPPLVNTAAAYSPLYFGLAVPFYALGRPFGVLGSLFAIRLLDLLLGLLATALTVLAGRQLWPGQPNLALAGGLLLAFQPMFSQGTTMANNDAALYAVGAGLVAAALAFLRRPPRVTSGLILGALAGLAFVVKPVGAALVLSLVPFLLLRLATRAGLLRTLREAAGMMAGGLLSSGWWVLLGYLTHSGSVGQLGSFDALHPHSLRAYLHLVRMGDFHYLFRAWVDWFWGNFAWLNTPLPNSLDLALEAVVALLVVGIGLWFVRRARDRRGDEPLPAQVAFLGLTVLTTVAFLQATDALLYMRSGQVLLQGRYLLVAGTAVFLALLVGGTALAPRRARGGVAIAMAGGMVALNIASLGVLWERFYT